MGKTKKEKNMEQVDFYKSVNMIAIFKTVFDDFVRVSKLL